MLASPSWRRIAAWTTGWLYLVGNITITLAVNFGTTLFFIACINVFEDSEGNNIFPASTYQTFLIFLAITILCNLVSSLCNKYLPWLDVSFFFSCLQLTCMRLTKISSSLDCRHLLDLCWYHCHCRLRPRPGQRGPP